jgi:hypothetical protein
MRAQDSIPQPDQATASILPTLVMPLARPRLVFNASLASFAAYGLFPAMGAWGGELELSALGLGMSLICAAIAAFQIWPLLFPPELAVFSPEGVRAPALFQGVIPWRMIRGCERPRWSPGAGLRLFVEEGAYDGVSRRAFWLMRRDHFDLELAFGNIDRGKAFEACSAFIAATRQDAPQAVFAYGRRRGDHTLETIQKGETMALWFAVILCLLIAGQMAYVAFGLA